MLRRHDNGPPLSFALPIRTARLILRAATVADVAAELAGHDAFSARICAAVPSSWPPGEYDADAQRYFLACLTDGGSAAAGWYGWYAIRTGDDVAPATVVASGGYFGPPSPEGVVELGYSVCPEWRGQGIASEMTAALARHAARQPQVSQVIAHTTHANPASIRVLERSGFVHVAAGAEPGQVRFAFAAPAE